MDDTGSLLKTVIERVRGYLDDADFDAKYTDQFLVKHVIMPALVDVWSRVSMNADNPVMLSYDITFVDDQECYVLPACVGEVHEIVQYTGLTGSQPSNGVPTDDLYPRHEMSVGGQIWRIEGNMLCFRPWPQYTTANTNMTWTVRYTTNGDMSPHYSSASAPGTLSSDRTQFTLAASPTLGQLDKRENAYAGQILRILDGSVFEERVIATYDPATRVATLKRPFSSSVTANTTHAYEVAPARAQGMVEAIALAASLKLGAWRKISQAQNQLLTQQYRAAIKTIGDNFANMQMRTGKGYAKDTRDNPRWRP